MSQLRAEEILPRELIETIQQYVSGKSIYSMQGEERLGKSDPVQAILWDEKP